ncbi:MAG: hypothetical protein ACFFER_13945, partial [Candidatus Thorarchaeota archaeon]
AGDDIQIQFYLKDGNPASAMTSAYESAAVEFLVIEDQESGYALDIELAIATGPLYWRKINVQHRPVHASYDGAETVNLGSWFVDPVDMFGKWTLWTVNLASGQPVLKVESLDSSFQVTGTLFEINPSQTVEVTTVTKVHLQDPRYWTQQYHGELLSWNIAIDHFKIISDGHTVLNEEFNSPHLHSLRGWETSGTGWGMSLQEYLNARGDEPILGINPKVLANPNSVTAWLEFCNGWYRVTRYDNDTYPGYLSGYTRVMEQVEPLDDYYQHYHSIVDIAETGFYDFKLEAITTSDTSGWSIWIDGVELEIVSSTVSQYLRKGLHTVYLRIHKTGDIASGHHNAFRVRLEKGGVGVTKAQAYIASHGRYAAVYYDAHHSQRLGMGEAPSFYEGASTALDHADILMGASPLLGMVVGMGAQELASYMMRDILTARYPAGGATLSPMVSTAGRVLFTSDLVPDTVFSGEMTDSKVENFLEAFGYILVDGAKPFSIVSHPNGATTEVHDSILRVMDLTEDSVYVTDGHYDHYNYLDVDSDHDYLDSDSADGWGTEYDYIVPIPSVDIVSQYQLYELKFSSMGFVLSKDTLGVMEEIYTDTESAFVIPPGDLQVTFTVLTTASSLLSEIWGGDIYGSDVRDVSQESHPTSVHARWKTTEIEQGPNMVYHVPAQYRRFLPEQQVGEIVQITIPLDLERDLTTTLFIDELVLRFKMHFLGMCKLLGVSIHDSFNVYFGDGLNNRMILPVGSSGFLSDMVIETSQPVKSMYVRSGNSVDFEIYDPTNQGTTPDASFSLAAPDSWRSGYPEELHSGNLTDQGLMLSDTMFDSNDGTPIPQYTVEVVKTSGKAALWMTYLWRIREDGQYTTTVSNTNWAVTSQLGISRSAGQVIAADIGRMLPINLENYIPRYCFDLQKLRNQGRKYIDYAGYTSGQATMANPITLQADSAGGGIVSYGLSTYIDYESVISNSTLSGVFMQLIASGNYMNLWGASEKKQSIGDVRVGVTHYDEIQVLGQEGWIDEWFDGNGILDTFTHETIDSNGADWFTPYQSEEVYDFEDDTILIRQPTQEMSTWDNDGRILAQKFGILEHAFQHPLIRYPKIRANYIEFDVNSTDLQDELAEGPLYLTAELIIRGWTAPRKEVTITQDTTVVRFDLDELAPEVAPLQDRAGEGYHRRSAREAYENRLLYDGSDIELEVSTPLLVTAIYKQDPDTLAAGDVVGAVSNLVYYGFSYQRMTVDRDYAQEYNSKWNKMDVNHAVIKPVMVVVGCAMMAAGAVQMGVGGLTTGVGALAGVPTFMFGLDMVTGNTLGFSILDENLKLILAGVFHLKSIVTGAAGPEFIKLGHEFSFFKFTSSSFINLIATQLSFIVLGGILSGGTGFKALLKGKISPIAQAEEAIGITGGRAATWLEGGAISEGLSILRDAQVLRAFSLEYMVEQLKHLGVGASLLFTIGAIGEVFGEGGLFAELLFQGVLFTSVIIGIYNQKFQSQIEKWRTTGENPTGLRAYVDKMKEVTKSVESSMLSKVPFLKSIPKIRAFYSVFGVVGGGAATVLLSLQLAQ